MYKHFVYCLNDEYEIETEGKASVYVHEEMTYIQNEEGEEVFVINKDRLEAISLNREVRQDERISETTYADGVTVINNVNS